MMKNFIPISILFISTFFLTACNKKVCLSENPYNGLYNALTCDYEARIDSIDQNTSEEQLKNLELFKAYQELLAKVSNKEKELSAYKQSIKNTEKLIKEIEFEIENMDTKQNTQNILQKIRYQVISMKKNMNTQEPIFTKSDIQFAKKSIKNINIKKTRKTILAEKFIKKHHANTEKLNHAYNKKHQANKKSQKALQKKLNDSIRAILMSEKANHLNKESKEKLMTVLKETKRYTNKVK